MTVFNNKEYLLERSIFGDFALIKVYKADKTGNAILRGSSNNFNQDMATAAKTVILEAEEIVEAGELDPHHIHIQGVFVDKVVLATKLEKRIEKLTVIKENKEGRF